MLRDILHGESTFSVFLQLSHRLGTITWGKLRRLQRALSLRDDRLFHSGMRAQEEKRPGVQSEPEGGFIMGPISGLELAVFKDMCGVHDFITEELVRLNQIAHELKEILSASKQREQDKFTKQGR